MPDLPKSELYNISENRIYGNHINLYFDLYNLYKSNFSLNYMHVQYYFNLSYFI